MATVFLGLRRCSDFGIHATKDNHYWRHLHENIKQKRCGKLSAGVLLLYDNTPTHKSCTLQAAIRKCGFVELNHPPCSPDLAPSDYFHFKNLKKFLHGRRFPDHNTVKEAVRGYFDTQDVSIFSGGIRSLEAKWTLSVVRSRGTALKNNGVSIRFNFHAQVDNLLNALRRYTF